jgi:hypothetical protein
MVQAWNSVRHNESSRREVKYCIIGTLGSVRLCSISVALWPPLLRADFDCYAVQALLLLCSFQQNTQRSTASWTYHALAVKTAIQHGLHSPSLYEQHGVQTRELRRRIWFGVINQDR